MPSLSVAKSHNSSFALPHIPVAIFVGGTAGIGEAMARSFAKYTNGKAHIVVIGRNQEAAESIIAKHEFIRCDVTLMKNIYDTCATVLARVSKINYVVLSAGIASFTGRQDSKEGLDKKLAIRYYSRWAFIDGLLPGLKAATAKGEHASALTILGAGVCPKVDIENLGFEKSYSPLGAILQTAAYNDLMVAELAKREPNITFTHMYPGSVRHSTPSIEGWGVKLVYYLFMLPFSAEYMLYALFQTKSGMYRRSDRGEDIGLKDFPGTEEEQKKVWEYSAKVIGMARSSQSQPSEV
ncbi:hypothetical protein BDQ17DRAFT_1392173 [Cyathus striatus]|nr:hypothetical protein BDQ17DRAFT_1392173 [Cyathus striatus]